MTDENTSTVIVNMHGLLGEQEVIQIAFEEELLQEKEQFVFDNVAYEIVCIINEDVEYPFSICRYSRYFKPDLITEDSPAFFLITCLHHSKTSSIK